MMKLAAAALLGVVGACSSESAQTAPTPTASGSETAQTTTTTTTTPTTTTTTTQHAEAHLAGGHITLEHQIQFETNSATILEGPSQAVIADIVSVLRENTAVRRVRVEGHTDVRGVAAANQDLSQRRAQAVADYLHSHGFENVTFEAVGYGQTQPLCQEATDACHERNRRVEFSITDPAPPAT